MMVKKIAAAIALAMSGGLRVRRANIHGYDLRGGHEQPRLRDGSGDAGRRDLGGRVLRPLARRRHVPQVWNGLATIFGRHGVF